MRSKLQQSPVYTQSKKSLKSNELSKSMRLLLFIFLILLVGIIVLFRVRTLGVALERDEGEYAYAAQLMLEGVPPYSLAYNMKMPGIYAAYAVLLAIFGQTHTGIHLGVLFINLATIILIFLLAKKIFNTLAGICSACIFAITCASFTITATANAENFVVLPAIASILLLIRYRDSRKKAHLIFSGLLLGVAFLMKQHAFGFILFAFIYLLTDLLKRKPFNGRNTAIVFTLYSISILMPFLITCLILWQCGVFENFWFWTFDYAGKYVSILSFKTGFNALKMTLSSIFHSMPLIWILAIVALPSFLVNKEIRKHFLFIFALAICSFLTVCPGLYFRNHYFVLFLPALSLLAAAAIISVNSIVAVILKSQNKAAVISMIILLTVWLHTFYMQRDYFLEKDPAKISRMIFHSNCFPEMLEIANYIKNHSTPEDKIAILGSEPEICFYAHRHSATPYIYMYPLMESQPYAVDMQKEMISQIEESKPRYFILVNNYFSWLPMTNNNDLISKWISNYGSANYRQIGLVEYFSSDKIEYHWDQTSVPSQGSTNIIICERIK
ncbi:MAG: glycosyltransferase family 39 protein [Phycisphaerales bacterium]